jgi:hypothetical protein
MEIYLLIYGSALQIDLLEFAFLHWSGGFFEPNILFGNHVYMNVQPHYRQT